MNMRILFFPPGSGGLFVQGMCRPMFGSITPARGQVNIFIGTKHWSTSLLGQNIGKVLKIFGLQILDIVIFPWNRHNHSLCHESTISPAVLCFIQRFSRKSAKTSNMPIHQGLISKYGIEWPWAIVFDDDDVKDGTSWWSYRCCSIDCTIIIYLMFWPTRWRFQRFMSGWMSLPKISESSLLSLTSR